MFSQKFGNWMHHVANCTVWTLHDMSNHPLFDVIRQHKTSSNIIQRPSLFCVCFTLPSQWISRNPPHRICTTPHHWSRRHREGRYVLVVGWLCWFWFSTNNLKHWKSLRISEGRDICKWFQWFGCICFHVEVHELQALPKHQDNSDPMYTWLGITTGEINFATDGYRCTMFCNHRNLRYPPHATPPKKQAPNKALLRETNGK